MPDLKNPDKKIAVSPRFFLNDAPKVSEQVKPDERLKLAARYVTDPENPWFARSFINRIWYCLMGEGFYNPVDDLGPTRTPNSPEILDLVSEQWVQSGYDIRWLFRTILNTDAYQRASRSTNTAAGRTPFASNVPSRLRADQIFDALTHALDLEHERDQVGKKAGPRQGRRGPDGQGARRPGSVHQDLRRRPLDPQRRRPRHDPPGPLPDEQRPRDPGGPGQAELDARLPPMTHADNRSVLDILYLRALGRRPSDKEVRTCSNYFNSVGNRAEAFEDILWALINSTEFLSRR